MPSALPRASRLRLPLAVKPSKPGWAAWSLGFLAAGSLRATASPRRLLETLPLGRSGAGRWAVRAWGRGAKAAGSGFAGSWILLVVCFLTSKTQVSWQMLLPWQPSLLRRPMLEKGVFSLIFLGVPGHQSARCSLPGLACSREGPAEPAHGRRIPGRGRRSSRSLLFPSRSGQLPLRVMTGRAGRGVPPPQSRGARAPPHRTVGWEWVPPFPTDGQGVAQACGAVRGEGRARRVALPLTPVRCPPSQCALLPESGLHQGAPCSLPEAQRQDGGPAAPRDTAGVGCGVVAPSGPHRAARRRPQCMSTQAPLG